MKKYSNFINTLKINNEAIWVEDNVLKLFILKQNQNEEIKDFIRSNKDELITILYENEIFSKEKFKNTLIFKNKTLVDFPLSYAQNRLWFVEHYESGTNAYHIPSLLEVSANADVEGIKYSLQQVVSRHEVLRSTLAQDKNNRGIQKVCDFPLSIEEISLGIDSDYEQQINKDINRPFDLSSGYPIRVKLYKIASIEKTLLLINLHHIAGDGWSMGIFQRELLAYYEAYFKGDMDFKLPDLEIQYKDYALWQREYLIGSVLEEQLSYWKDKLSGYQTLNFPTDYSRPLTIDYKGASEGFRLSKDLSDKLRKLSRLRGVTLNSVLLSSVNILFGKYTGQDDIVIGSVTANRHYRQIEDLIGFFVNTQVNRTRLNNSQSFESLIDNVHKDQIEAQLYQDLPFENLIEELGVVRDSSRHAIFQVTFGLQSFGSELKVSEAPKSFLKPYYLSDSYEIEKFDLSVFVDDSGEELVGQISYATSLFKSETITKLINHYIHLLTELTTTPARPYAEISLLNSVDYNQIIHSWNATDTEYSNDKTLIDLFEEQVLRTPDNISLVYENQELTYGELNKKSNQLARHIRSRYKERTGTDLKSDTLIVLCLDRSLEMIIGILGVLKAGGAYVPMDPSYPQDRIDYILEDTKSELVLSQRDILKDKDATLPVELVVYIDLTEPLYKDEDGSVLPSYSSPNDLAYIIYTSGTTGNPKGVMVEHSSVTNLICDLKIKYRIENLERFLLFANYVFDASCEQMNLCLLSGGILFIPSKETIRDFEKFINFVQNNVITHLNATPSYLASLDPLKLKSVKRTIFGGEYLSIEVFESYKKYIPIVINVYGPTETTISSLVSINTYLLNKPSIQNTKIYILDDADQPVPVGVVGELYIGGAGLSRGYLNNEKLTSERFVSNPFATEKDIEKGYTRLYKTGDLVRWLPGGNLEYIGRNDDQVKIRGYRIELGEIEYALRSIEGITQSCILAKERETDLGFVKYLVGYYVLESDVSEAFILDALSKVLPDYMIPSSLVKMDSFPLTINGKLDKKGLPAPEFTVSDDLYVAPTTETEKVLCGIWEEVLGIGRVGVTDDFFRIGGDSILSIQVSSRIRQLGFSCNVRDIFESKTISKLILLIEAKDSKEFIKSEQGVLEGDFDLLPIQQWFLERVNVNLLGSANHWNQSFLVRVPALDTAKLLSILASLVSHHDMLRIGYRMEGDSFELKQFYQSNISIPELRTLDVNLLSKEELHLALTQWQSSFNLELGPLFQVGYLHGYEDDSARIYFALHHMLVDGVSWRILSDDLKKLYIGESLGLKGSSYRQWVSSIRNYTKANPEEGLYWESQFNGLPHYNQLVSDSSQSTSYLELEESYTRILLQDISTAYYTEINDLLLTALGYALKDVNGLDIQGITLEGHGREPIDPAIDHSHTLGWFTSIFPVKLELKDSLRGSIQFIKDTLHRVPNKGIGFGSFAVSETSPYSFSDLVPISFNYLGQFEVGDEARDWEVVTSEDSGMPIGPLNQDHTIININGAVQKGRLGFRIDSKLGAQATEDFSNSFKHHLIAIIAHCQDSLEELGSLYSSSDFESVDLSQSLLDDLQVWASSTQNSISGIYPASSLQQGFIYHAISQPEDDAYRVQLLYDYHDALDIDKYLQAWEYCIAEYPILRTSFNWEEELIQVVYRRGHLEYELHDISELVKQEARDQKIKSIQLLDRGHGFDLTKPSLFRLHIIKQSETLYTILKTDHHSIGDGWSGPVLLKSLNGYYESLIAGESIDVKEDIAYLKTQEYIYTHKSVVSNYWDGLLSEVEGANDINALLSNPIDLTSYRTVGNSSSNAIEIKGSVYEELKSFSQREGVTINVIVQFIWHKLLQVYSSSPHSIVGTTVSGRDLPIEGIEESVGLFINTLPLVVNWDNDNSILSQLHDIQKQITGLNSNSFANLSKLQKGEGRLFHSLFVFENYPTPKGSSREISKARMRDAIEKSDYPLNIKAYEYSDALTIELQYDGDYLTEEKVNSHLVRLEQILGQVISTPDQLHSGISLLNSEEYDQIVHSWNATDVDYPSDRTIYGMFEEQVEKSPDNIALVYEGSELTYKELNERSNQLARHLRAGYQGRTGEELGPDTLIALCLDRGLEMIIGILGVLKAGGAYAPMDPGYPQERIDYILEDTKSELVLSQREVFKDKDTTLPQDRVVYIDLTEALYQQEDDSNLSGHSSPNDLAYVIYTSGTTGKPKGVMINHSGIVNRIEWMQSVYPLNSEDVVIQKTPYVFDVSVWEILWANWYGAKIIIAKPEGHKDSVYLYELIKQNKVTTLHFVPSMLEAYNYYLSENKLTFNSSLKKVFSSGEALSKQTVINTYNNSNIKEFKLHNLYGPTEASIDVTFYETNSEKDVYIGKPINNTQLHVLDQGMNPVPIGVIGELYLGGAGLSRGYLNREDLTRERFVDNPFATEKDKEKGYTRLYRTGDLVRWLPDGNLEYIGRNDDQVKIRGYRIELGEIESVLSGIEGVLQSCVLAKEDTTDSEVKKYLVGYYVLDEMKYPTLKRISNHKKRGYKDKVNLFTMPNGIGLYGYNKSEMDFLYKEIFTDKTYLRNKIKIPRGGCIIDVGANLGVFSVFANFAAKDIKLYSFEPIPPTYEVLKLNTELYGTQSNFKVFNYGLSNKEEEVIFTHYPNSTILSSRYVEKENVVKTVKQFIVNSEENGLKDDANIEEILQDMLTTEEYKCKLRTISQVIEDEGIEIIDLLKIDVEKAEIDVLEGIKGKDWRKIKQIVLEVHDDPQKGVSYVQQLLTDKGFNVVVEQSPDLENTQLYDIYAIAIDIYNQQLTTKSEVHIEDKYLIHDVKNKFINELESRLPDYMVPQLWVEMDSFPLTINGKLDKKALLDAEFGSQDDVYVAPGTETEKALCGIWEEVLGLDRVGVTDNFFRIGGDSILSIKLTHRMGAYLDRDIKSSDIFKYPRISELLIHNVGSSQVVIPRIESDSSTLSFSQERLWFIEQYSGGTNAYHIPVVLELESSTDILGIKYGLAQVVSRHEVLRSFIVQDNSSSTGVQVVQDLPLEIAEFSLTEDDDYESLIKEAINRPFELSKEYPIRVQLYRIAPLGTVRSGKTLLLINVHHIAGDGWSMDVFQRELYAYYDAYIQNDKGFNLPPLNIQYKDYAMWQRSYLTEDVLDDQLAYWRKKLSGYEPLEFPIDCLRPSEIDYSGASENFVLDKELSKKLRSLAQDYGVTLNSVMLSSVNVLLSKYTGQQDIVTGSITANRHYAQTGDLIGFFVNTQVNRSILKKRQNYKDLIVNVHKDQLEAQSYQDLPFERLVDDLGVERDSSRHPVFQVLFGVQSFGSVDTASGTNNYFKVFELEQADEIEKFDMSIFIDDGGEELVGSISYATSLFNNDTIERLVAHYVHLLTELVSAPNEPYNGIGLLNSEEYDQIVHSWNATDVDYPSDRTIYGMFEEQVEKSPDNIALVYEGSELTYKELNERSNQLARHLRAGYQGRTGEELGPDTLIALCLDRGLEMVIGILGVLKAGGAYVPMDPGYPQDRIDYILEDTKSELVLSQREVFKDKGTSLPQDRVVYIDLTEALYQQEDGSNLSGHSSPNDLAYVIYTSGTTGKPKGVMITHSGIVNRLRWMQTKYPLNSKDIVLQKTPYVFDVSVWELLWANWYGAKIIMAKPEGHKDSEYLYNLIKHQNVTTLHFVPSMLDAYNYYVLKEELPFNNSLRQVFCSGEALSKQTVINVYTNSKNKDLKLHNLYGPTEASIDVTFYETNINQEVNIGSPIDNTRAYVLDSSFHPVPVGVIGELYIGGAGLSRGYLNREDLTKERFVDNPFATEKDKEKGYTRLYRTGDLVRWLPDGNLEYIGRNDDQVKIRGYRIELGEIEHALTSIEQVSQSCVLTKERETESGTSKYLVGYYVLDGVDSDLSEESILGELSNVLPEYMVPSSLVKMDSFPLTINGKLDKKALPDAEFGSQDDVYVAPGTEMEKALCGIWEEVLGLDRVGVTDDFFRIGGDSILSIQVLSRIRGIGLPCQVRDIFDHRTISKLSTYLSTVQDNSEIKVDQGLLTGVFDLLPIQDWFVYRVNSGDIKAVHHWNQSFLIKVPKLDLNNLESVIKELVSYHDVLRICYIKNLDTGTWVQKYQSNISIPALKILDVKDLTANDIEEELTDWQSGFDLFNGPLFQVGYLEGYSDGSCRIFFALHHMIVDGVSWRILTEDIALLYSGVSLPEKQSSYRQWVSRASDYVALYPEESSYWESNLLEDSSLSALDEFSTESQFLFELDELSTIKLLQQIGGAYHTEINDLLLTALGYALKDITGNTAHSITLEGHGREVIDNDTIDHSHIVGWFTTMFPVKLNLAEDDIGQSIKQVKEKLRKIPNKGVGFGSFAVSDTTNYGHNDLPLITFNYLGQFENREEKKYWQIITENSGLQRSLENSDHNLININGAVRSGKLGFSIVSKFGEAITDRLGVSFKESLLAIIGHCEGVLAVRGKVYTSSDFKDKDIMVNERLLDNLQEAAFSNELSISAIYPANSLQKGFIYHSINSPKDDTYRVQMLNDYNGVLDIPKYLKAWEYCIDQYPILRSSFNWEENPIQIIYNKGKFSYKFHDISDLVQKKSKNAYISSIQQEDKLIDFDLTQPTLIRIHIIKQSETLYTILKTEHHSIGKGWSSTVLMNSLNNYYESLIEGELINVREDTAYLEAQERLILQGKSEKINLIKPFYLNHRNDLENMIFIHPAGAGSEPYLSLAEILKESYNCIGVENYNLEFSPKIYFLSELANYYLTKYEQQYKLKETINLLSYSMGGLLALEMAVILEMRGFKNVNVILLDTFFKDNFLLEFHSKNIEIIKQKLVEELKNDENENKEYLKNIASCIDAELAISRSLTSQFLENSKVTLFKVDLLDSEFSETEEYRNAFNYLNKKNKYNFVDLAVNSKIDVVQLEGCSHGNILDLKHKEIGNYILKHIKR